MAKFEGIGNGPEGLPESLEAMQVSILVEPFFSAGGRPVAGFFRSRLPLLLLAVLPLAAGATDVSNEGPALLERRCLA